jgi:surface antigen
LANQGLGPYAANRIGVAAEGEDKGDLMIKGFACAVAAAMFVAACSHTGTSVGPREGVGTVAGAVAGGVIGSQIGRGRGSVVAGTIGAIAGGLIGMEVGRALDERDRQLAREAEYRALAYGRPGRPIEWRSPHTGYYGEVVAGPGYEVNRLNCRDYTHTVYIDGTPQVARGTACQEPDGTWRTV